MASIRIDEILPASAEHAWSLLREVHAAHRCFAGVLVECRQEEPGLRAVTFASGKTVREHILDLDHTVRRVAQRPCSSIAAIAGIANGRPAAPS